MPTYGIGLAGLSTSAEAMDVISNNIANASTSGYRAGDFVFEDQFYKAFNPLDKARAGMGDARPTSVAFGIWVPFQPPKIAWIWRF